MLIFKNIQQHAHLIQIQIRQSLSSSNNTTIEPHLLCTGTCYENKGEICVLLFNYLLFNHFPIIIKILIL